jgi:hypothetical protein
MAFDLTNEVFGKLTVVRKTDRLYKGDTYLWECRCTCGGTAHATTSMLRSGHKISCGCLARQRASRGCVVDGCGRAHEAHGYCGLHYRRWTKYGDPSKLKVDGRSSYPESSVWYAMIQRCSNPARPNYRAYGGRGIKVCNEWRDDFFVFLRDMGPRPSPQHQIDRIDNGGGYRPGNCRWVLPEQNARNRRGGRVDMDSAVRIRERLTAGGTVAGVAAELSVPYRSVHHIQKRLQESIVR